MQDVLNKLKRMEEIGFLYTMFNKLNIFVYNLYLYFLDNEEPEKFLQPKFKPTGPIRDPQSKGKATWD